MKLLLKKFSLVVLLSMPALSINAAAGGNNTVLTQAAVTTCTASNSKCNASIGGKNVLNAVGDVMKIQFTQAEVKDLGIITEEKTLTLDLPRKKDEKKFYSFTPTSGESQDMKINVAFVNMPLLAGTRLGSMFAGKNLIVVYRQFANEKSTQWVEIGEISSQEEMAFVNFTLMPDGVAKADNPMNPGEKVLFNVGKMDLKA